MRYLFFFILSFFSIITLGQNIKKHQWKNRVLLVISNDQNNGQLKKQFLLLEEHPKELIERKLVVYCFLKNKYQYNFKGDWKPSTKFKNEKGAFKVLLVGLDGGVKLQQDSVLSTEKLFTIIDGMPMRKRELQKNKK
ncbi:DUF4174 domain-containing protein [uncultured Polaribacter sp.]|uniref:DUF4174 domain-containing protein n=1 Tax=uncultured Polaribacter sp. TaxID=174711 RepID=UPI002623BD9C|nr:DUF4174 domain-containing protein [uncultured Polaribacter sp.]